MATKYMHTIDGRPAVWSGEQIVWPYIKSTVVLEDNLKTIRQQQLKAKEFRMRNKFDYNPGRYGYVRVKVEEP
jgi:hypothetical protein